MERCARRNLQCVFTHGHMVVARIPLDVKFFTLSPIGVLERCQEQDHEATSVAIGMTLTTILLRSALPKMRSPRLGSKPLERQGHHFFDPALGELQHTQSWSRKNHRDENTA